MTLSEQIEELKKRAHDLSVVGVIIEGIRIIGESIERRAVNHYEVTLLKPEPPQEGTLHDHIRQFHKKFYLDYEGDPRQLPEDLEKFRIRFMQEELDEYRAACEAGDLEKQLDALVDLVYVAIGTADLQGFPFQRAWNAVHVANMKKIRTQRPTERGGGWDVVKPQGWKAPSLKALVAPRFKEGGK